MIASLISPLNPFIRRLSGEVSLRSLLTIPFMIQVVAAVGLTGYLAWRNGQKMVNHLVTQLQDEIIDQVEQQLNLFLEKPKLVTQYNKISVQVGDLNLDNFSEVRSRLFKQIQVVQPLNFMQFGTENGDFIGIERKPDNDLILAIKTQETEDKIITYQLNPQGKIAQQLEQTTQTYDPRQRLWYQTALQTNQAQWVDLYEWVSQPNLSLTFVQPLHNEQGQLVGVIGADVSLIKFNQFLQKQKLGQSGEIFIMERSGLLIADSTDEQVFDVINNEIIRKSALDSQSILIQSAAQFLQKEFGEFSQIQKNYRLKFEYAGMPNCLQVVPFQDPDGLDWLIVIVVPEADFMAEIHQNTRHTILLCLAAAGVTIILGMMTSRWVTKPVTKLTHAAHALSEGNWQQTVQVNQTRELGILASTFNHMSQQLQQSYQQLEDYSKQLEQKVAERTQELEDKLEVIEAAKLALQESEERFATIFRSAPIPVIMTRLSDGTYFDVNESFCQTTGYSREEAINHRSLNLNLWVNPADYQKFYSRLESDGKLRNYELNFRTKSGEIRTGLISADKIRIGSEEFLLSGSQDITERKKVEAALKQSEATLKQQNLELEKARKAADAANRAKSTFLANMSHELRTPLNAILGFSQLMAQNPSLKQASKDIDIINRSGEHLLSLINDILDFSKIEAGKVSLEEHSFDLQALLQTLIEMLKLKATSKGIQLIYQPDDNLPQYIQSDEKKLRQVLINILGNGIKFTEQGSVTLRAKLSHEIEPDIKVIHFEVEDTGYGIASHEISLIFDAFTQTEAGQKSHQGTGLGLPISRKFVQMMGGDISVRSVLGKGSLFQFKIKAKLASAQAVQLDQKSQRVVRLATGQPEYRILVVDEVSENRLLVRKLLEPLGFKVLEAENGLEALQQWEDYSPQLIWMDIRMPVMDGYEATRRIKAQPNGEQTVIIALTASAIQDEEKGILAAGCNDILRKPFKAENLLNLMAQHLGVCYVYDTDQPLPDLSNHPTQSLTAAALEKMPQDWINHLHQAALTGDDAWVRELMLQIPKTDTQLIDTLTVLVDDFRLDMITDVTESLISHE